MIRRFIKGINPGSGFAGRRGFISFFIKIIFIRIGFCGIIRHFRIFGFFGFFGAFGFFGVLRVHIFLRFCGFPYFPVSRVIGYRCVTGGVIRCFPFLRNFDSGIGRFFGTGIRNG